MSETQQITIWHGTKLNRQERIATTTTIASMFVISGATATTPLSSSFGFKNIFLYLGLWVFIFSISTVFFYMRRKNPAATINQNGIWVKHYGLIPWNNINDVAVYPVSRKLYESSIYIEVNKPQMIATQADWYGKLTLWRTTPCIYLANLDIKHKDADNITTLYQHNKQT